MTNKPPFFVEFLENNPNVYNFVVDKSLRIIDSNHNLSGNILDYLNDEDRNKFNLSSIRDEKARIYFHLTHPDKGILTLKANIYSKNNYHYIFCHRCKVSDMFEKETSLENDSLSVIILDYSGCILESNSVDFKVNDSIFNYFIDTSKNEFKSAFKHCIQEQRISGFERSDSYSYDSSITYRFIPEKESKRITLVIKNYNFKNSNFIHNNYFQDLIDSTADFIFRSDVHGNLIFVNETLKKRYGFDLDITKKPNFKEWIRDDYKLLVEKFYLNQFQSKIETSYLEFPTITNYGEEIWIGQNLRMVFSGSWVLSVQATCRDITQNKAIENELIEIQSKNQAILDSIPDSMFLFDENYTLLDKKVEEDTYFFDLQVGENIMQSNMINLSMESIKDAIDKCLKKQEISKLELLSNVTGEEFIYDLRIAPVNETQALLLIRNITQRILEQRKLQKSQEKEREALNAKQRYLSFMSHEIRTPLHAIIGLTDLIFDTNPTPKQKEYLKRIGSSSSILSKIINDVLDFNKLENGKIKLEEIVFNLQTIFKEVIKTCTVYSFNKPLTLNYEIDKRIPPILKGDALKLTQVLTNLISNGIKFTSNGKVVTTAKLLQIEGNQAIIEFHVIDTGIGIKENQIEKVFNSYEQLDSSISRKYGGTGLGLTISQHFVMLMGGKIQVKSSIGEGSDFSFILPFELTVENIKKESQLKQVDFSPYHILLVEDNEMNQLVMSKYFNKWGLSYDIAENGEDALELINDREYNLILLDLEMPVMDGFETASMIRAHENDDVNNTPIIALSASAYAEVENRTKEIGFNDFIGKPINANNIYKKLSEYLTNGIVPFQPIENKEDEIQKYSIDNSYFDLSYLIETSLNDSKYVQKMVDLFIEKSPSYIEELYLLYEENNFIELKKVAHKYKASVAIMGIQKAEFAIHNLENIINLKGNYKEIPRLLENIKESSFLACKELKEHLESNKLSL